MKKYLFLLLFCYSPSFAQVQLEIHYNGKSESTDLEVFKYKEYITNSTEKVVDIFPLSSTSSRNINLDLTQPSRLLIKDNKQSRKFYVQPKNSYKLIIEDDSIYIDSEDEINTVVELLESKITEYFKKNYEIELDDEKNKRKRTFDLMEEFTTEIEGLNQGTDFQKQLVKYRLIDVISGTYYFLQDRKLFRQIENDIILERSINFQNASYMHFLLNYYFRKFQVYKFHNNKYDNYLSGFEIAKLESSDLPDKVMQQVLMVNFIQKYYKSINSEERQEAVQFLDSLSVYGLHDHIKLASANLIDRYAKLGIGLEIPNFSMIDLAGKDVALSDFKGEYILLDFWFIGCAPCQRGVPYKKKLNEEFGNCLNIVSINPINDAAAIAKYKDKDNLPWTFTSMDRNDTTLSDLNVTSYPTYYLLDPEGKILLNPEFTGSIEGQFKLIEDELMKICQ